MSRALGLGQATTARVLAAGLAGPGHRRGRSVLHDRETVRELVRRQVVLETTPLPAACDDGVLVARVDPRRRPDGDWRELARGPWRISMSRRLVLAALLTCREERRTPVPLVVTVASFVIGGAELTRFHPCGDRTRLDLAPPGSWYEALEGRRVDVGPGEPLLFWRCAWSPPITHHHPAMTTVEELAQLRPARPPAAAG